MNPQIFREYDIRGVVEKDLNPQLVKKLGQGYATYLSRFGKKKVVVGRDCLLYTSDAADE